MLCWEFNTKSGEIKPAEYERQDIVLTGSGINKISRKVVTKDYCFYCVAINKDNAERKFLKLFRL